MKNPNVLVIMSDQHRHDALGSCEDSLYDTPHLDELAERGVKFSNTYCAFPICGPSRMSFMTCRYPHEINLLDNEAQLNSDVPTFAHAFTSGGYHTAIAGRMHFVGDDQYHGFQERIISDVQESVHLAAGWKLETVLGDLKNATGMGKSAISKSGPGETGYQLYDQEVTRVTTDWLSSYDQAGDDPFLLTVGYIAPHCPFIAPQEDFDFFADKISIDDESIKDANSHPVTLERNARFGVEELPDKLTQWRVKVAYYGLCRFLDRQIGSLISALKDNSLYENTIIVYTSDHGEMLGDHGTWWKSSFYEESSKVPLIVSYPKELASGKVVADNVSLSSVGSTILDLVGLNSLPNASCGSFKSLLNDTEATLDDYIYSEYIDFKKKVACRMVKFESWKYIYYHGHMPELFDLSDDPKEKINLAADKNYADICQQLKEKVLDGWNPDQVEGQMEVNESERCLLKDWIMKKKPAEPFPPWFSGLKISNNVDVKVRPNCG